MVLDGSITLVIGSCVGLIADIFNHANLVLTALLLGTVRIMRAIPLGSIEIEKPSFVWVLLWYAVLALAVFMLKERQKCAEIKRQENF